MPGSGAQVNVVSTLVVVAVLALAHVIAGRLKFLSGIPRSRWLSVAGGIAVAYVFVHLLPELAESQRVLTETLPDVVPFIEDHVYLMALVGLAAFYGVERGARRSSGDGGGAKDASTPSVFWVSMSSFAIYNALIGYLVVHREESGLLSLILFGVAMAVHFVVNDHALQEDHKRVYERLGRWILVAALFVGWAIGVMAEVSEAAIAVLLAFLAGGIILNVLKEELPEERESRFSAFALGLLAYTVVLVAI